MANEVDELVFRFWAWYDSALRGRPISSLSVLFGARMVIKSDAGYHIKRRSPPVVRLLLHPLPASGDQVLSSPLVASVRRLACEFRCKLPLYYRRLEIRPVQQWASVTGELVLASSSVGQCVTFVSRLLRWTDLESSLIGMRWQVRASGAPTPALDFP